MGGNGRGGATGREAAIMGSGEGEGKDSERKMKATQAERGRKTHATGRDPVRREDPASERLTRQWKGRMRKKKKRG